MTDCNLLILKILKFLIVIKFSHLKMSTKLLVHEPGIERNSFKTLVQQLENVQVTKGLSELSFNKSFVCIVGWRHNKELKYSVTQITHCLDNKGMFCFSLQHMKLNF